MKIKLFLGILMVIGFMTNIYQLPIILTYTLSYWVIPIRS